MNLLKNLVIPDKAAVQLVGKNLLPLRLACAIFRVTFFARRRNNFTLQPFVSDENGLVSILKRDIQAHIRANYSEDLMGHYSVDDCIPSLEIRLLTADDVAGAIKARTEIWTDLLEGERDRWNSMDELLSVYRSATNATLLSDQSPPIRDDWNRVGVEYSYNCVVVPR
jgi:hypothetical protein